MDTTHLVHRAAPTEYPPVSRGYIAPTKPAPVSFTEGVYVVLPEGSAEHLYGPCKWGAIHGTRLPAAGAACVVVFDEQGFPTVAWWDGAQTEPVPPAASITEAMLAVAVREKLNPTAWTELAYGPKLEAFAGLQTPGWRAEAGKTTLRLRGVIKVKAGETLHAKETLFTLPEGARPPGKTDVICFAETNTATTVALLTISTAGVVQVEAWLAGTEAGAGKVLVLDGLTINLT